jgi:outer membrane protein TolC
LPDGNPQRAPLLAAAQSAAQAAAAREQAARRAQWPQLALTGGWDHNAIQFDQRAVDTWQIMLVLKLNLWSGGAQRAAIASARASREEATDRTRQAELNLTAASAGAIAAWHAQSKAYLAATAGLAAADESAHIERDRFKVGLGSATDLIDAEAALAQARAGVANALAAWWEADDALRYTYGEAPLALTEASHESSAAQGH